MGAIYINLGFALCGEVLFSEVIRKPIIIWDLENRPLYRSTIGDFTVHTSSYVFTGNSKCL